MRYLAIAAVLLTCAAGCGDSASQPSSSATDEDFLRITLQNEDVPPAIATLSEAQVVVIPVDSKQCLLPSESPEAAPSTLVFRTFDAPEPFPARGAQRVIVTSVLHSKAERARSEFACASAMLSQGDTQRLLQPEWQLLSYEELTRPDVGEERTIIHYVAVNAEGLVFLETYWSEFRRGEVTAVLNIRAPLDNISLAQFESLALKLDQRIQEGLGSLQ